MQPSLDNERDSKRQKKSQKEIDGKRERERERDGERERVRKREIEKERERAREKERDRVNELRSNYISFRNDILKIKAPYSQNLKVKWNQGI